MKKTKLGLKKSENHKMGAKDWVTCNKCKQVRSLVITNQDGDYECCFCFDIQTAHQMHHAGFKCPQYKNCWCENKPYLKFH